MENTVTLEGKKVGRGVVALIALLALLAWSKRKEVAAAIKPPGTIAAAEAVTAKQAEALITSPTELVAANLAFVATHPTAYSMIEQANAQIASGQASVGDILRFDVDKAYYAKYVAEGGIAGYEEFTTQTQYWTPEYEAAKQEARDTTTQYRANEAETGYWYETDAYGNIVGTNPEKLSYYINLLSPENPVRQELERRHPELVPVEEEPTPTATTEEVAASVEQDTVPEGWTATVDQLKELEDAGYSQESETYEKAVDAAYEAAASTASKKTASTGESHSVSWSSSGGYSTISSSDPGYYAT